MPDLKKQSNEVVKFALGIGIALGLMVLFFVSILNSTVNGSQAYNVMTEVIDAVAVSVSNVMGGVIAIAFIMLLYILAKRFGFLGGSTRILSTYQTSKLSREINEVNFNDKSIEREVHNVARTLEFKHSPKTMIVSDADAEKYKGTFMAGYSPKENVLGVNKTNVKYGAYLTGEGKMEKQLGISVEHEELHKLKEEKFPHLNVDKALTESDVFTMKFAGYDEKQMVEENFVTKLTAYINTHKGAVYYNEKTGQFSNKP